MKKQHSDYGILYIDDEMKSLKYFEAIFEDLAPIYIANSPEKGFSIFQTHHEKIGLVISDKKMPNESGLELLARIRAYDPKPLRFLVTAHSDLDVAVAALNDGLLYSYLTKPWDPEEFEHRLVKAMGHFTLARDKEKLIQERAETIEQLIMADKAASIGILSTGLNHHMRNALTVLRTFHDMLPYQLEEELNGTPKDELFWKDYYREVGGQIDRMTSMLANLSEGTRPGGAAKEESEIDFAGLVRATGELVLKSSPGIALKVEVESNLPAIVGDSGRIAQMSRFLFEDSCSTLKGEGEVEVRISSANGGESVEAIFIDSGEPMPDEDLGRLFDPFFVRASKPEELGTHLMACYLTVFQHGGSIRGERTEDGRNAIVVSLPVRPPRDGANVSSRRFLSRFSEQECVELKPSSAELSA